LTIKCIEIYDWVDFESALRKNLDIDYILVRNFEKITTDLSTLVETDRFEIAKSTGTDRCPNSKFWNAPNFDYEHDKNQSGKSPNEIIYASHVNLTTSPYQASIPDGTGRWSYKEIDLTTGLCELNAIIIYDPAQLERKTANEYWFKGDPIAAVLLLVSITED
jgi:hypothetical protein